MLLIDKFVLDHVIKHIKKYTDFTMMKQNYVFAVHVYVIHTCTCICSVKLNLILHMISHHYFMIISTVGIMYNEAMFAQIIAA